MIFVDLDMTLYDTEKFVQDICAVFGECGVKTEDAVTAKQSAVHTQKSLYFDYTFERHIEALSKMGYKLDEESVLAKLKTLLTDIYIFPGAVDFLQSLQKTKHKVILLTAGNPIFQRAKVYGAGLNNYIHYEAYIAGGKEQYVAAHAPNEDIFFINDNGQENVLVKKTIPKAEVITKLNPIKSYHEELEQLGIPIYSNFDDIINYVNKHLS